MAYLKSCEVSDFPSLQVSPFSVSYTHLIPLFSYNTPILKSEKIQNATKKGTTPYYGYVTLQ